VYIRPKVIRPFPEPYTSRSYMHRAALLYLKVIHDGAGIIFVPDQKKCSTAQKVLETILQYSTGHSGHLLKSPINMHPAEETRIQALVCIVTQLHIIWIQIFSKQFTKVHGTPQRRNFILTSSSYIFIDGNTSEEPSSTAISFSGGHIFIFGASPSRRGPSLTLCT
jgi:hypothetical protein